MGTIVRENNRNPEYHSWNLSIQREVGWQSVVEINYTGSRGTHLFMPITTLSPLDPSPSGRKAAPLSTQQVTNPFFGQITDSRSSLSLPTVQRQSLLRPMPQFTGTSVGTAEPARGDSNYHALQLKWEKRFSHGLSMLSHYTWSKMIDNVSHSSGNVSWLGGSTSLQNIWDLRGERSLSSHDIASRGVVAGSYELPVGRRPQVRHRHEPCARLDRRRLELERYAPHAERHADCRCCNPAAQCGTAPSAPT